jgi:hypothetical protein
MYEKWNEPFLPRTAFLKRLLSHFGWAVGLVSGSLVIGIAGYHFLEGQSWLDAFVNAAMLLGGMGPVGELHNSIGKLFAGCYALYAGLVFLVAAGLLSAPVFHRILHRFHVDGETEQDSQDR